MPKKLGLNEHNKDFIVHSLKNKTLNVTQLANHYGCHPKTINRVMAERGLSPIASRGKGPSEAARIKKMLAEANVNADQLSQLLMVLLASKATDPDRLSAILTQPVLTIENVQRYLNQCTKDQLAKHFYASGLSKLAEIIQANAARKSTTAALFKPGAQESHADATQPG